MAHINSNQILFKCMNDCTLAFYTPAYICPPTAAIPSQPLSPMVIWCNDTTATISWTAPSNSGGRSDVFYMVGCKSAKEEEFNYASPTSPITATQVNITGLQPLTYYSCMVVAGNGITAENKGLSPLPRTSSPTNFTTKEGGIIDDTTYSTISFSL